jgi:hypothetical protein
MTSKTTTIAVKHCARCGRDHKSVTFRRFRNSTPLGGFSSWASCPRTGEPILLRCVPTPA